MGVVTPMQIGGLHGKFLPYSPEGQKDNDPDHSAKENRFILLGLSYKIRTLVVCHCIRNAEKEIRIISARKATKKEQKDYNRGLK